MAKKSGTEPRSHERFMLRCLELAEKGAGFTSPNPMVGSVIVHDNAVIGEGYHEQYGKPHAEVNAIAAVHDHALLQQSSLYVNLEPCSHHGKTPPCSDLIIEKKIPRVIVACRDPHKKVAGRGMQRLREAGVEVIEGVLQEEAQKLNEAFFKSHVKNMPFVALKLAQTFDGKIATAKGLSKWITGQQSREHVHRLRSRYDAVLTGAATVVADDPLLTVRHCAGRNPLRVVLDRDLRLPETSRVFNTDAPTLVFASEERIDPHKYAIMEKKGVEIVVVPEHAGGLDIKSVLAVLHKKNILSVFVESGSRLSGSFLRLHLADKVYMYIAPKIFGGDGLSSFAPLGVDAPEEAVRLRFEQPSVFGNDVLLEAYLI